MGSLLSALQVGRDGMPSAQELGQDRWEVDPASQCPAEAPIQMVSNAGLTPRTIQAAPVRLAEPLPPTDAAPPETVQQTLAGWAAAWSSKDFPRYRGYYAKSFTPEDARSLEQWASERAARLNKPGDITIGINDLKVDTSDADKAVTEFKQSYTSVNYSGVVSKRLEWIREGDTWKIQREQVLGTPKTPVPSLMENGSKKKRA
jgi:hypothetical protein